MKICSKYTANRFWDAILFHDHPHGCQTPTISFPFSDNLSPIQHGGCLLGDAVQSELLTLTPSAQDTYGAIVYNFPSFQHTLEINFDFRIDNPSLGGAADATFVYFDSSEDPLTEDASISGYLIGFSEFHGFITVMYGNDLISEQGEEPGFPLTINTGTPYSVDITFDTGVFNITVNSVLIGTCTDSNYGSRAKDASHVKFGLGARCGTEFVQHSVSNLVLANTFG